MRGRLRWEAAEGPWHGIQRALPPAREARGWCGSWPYRPRAPRSEAYFHGAPSPRLGRGPHSPALDLRAALRSAPADCSPLAIGVGAMVGTRTPAAQTYPRDRVARNETPVDRSP